MSGVTELGLLALTLTGQQRFGNGGGLVRFVAASFAMKIDARIAGILGWGLGIAVVLALEALVSCPGLDRGSIDREVLIGEQALRASLTQHAAKNPSATSRPASGRDSY